MGASRVTYWIRWQSAAGGGGPRIGPFRDRWEAVSRVEAEMNGFAANLEHGTGVAGVWEWETMHEVAALYRDDMLDDICLGRYIIEKDG